MLKVPGSQRQNLMQTQSGRRLNRSAVLATRLSGWPKPARIVRSCFLRSASETTAPTTACSSPRLKDGTAESHGLCNHVLTPPRHSKILKPVDGSSPPQLEGLMSSHVSVITGMAPTISCPLPIRSASRVCGLNPGSSGILTLVRRTNDGIIAARQYTCGEQGWKLRAQSLYFSRFLSYPNTLSGVAWVHAARCLRHCSHLCALMPDERRFSLETAAAFDNRACACLGLAGTNPPGLSRSGTTPYARLARCAGAWSEGAAKALSLPPA